MGDEESFGLNIVCEAPKAASTGNGGGLVVKRKKKASKYERRRNRTKNGGHIVVQQQEQQQQEEEEETSAITTPLNEEVVTSSDTVTKEQEETAAPVLVESEEAAAQVEPSTTTDSSTTVPVPSPTVPPSAADPSIPTEPIIPSRKKHNAATLEDDDERAKYMAEFHARPLEMDRRSGAKAFCTPSRDSTHIFDTTEEATNDDGTTSDIQPPSLNNQLHPRLRAHCVQQFQMKQATMVQSNTWSQFFSSKDANLFVQSETGSGKTLAYLLPIIQSLTVDSKNEFIRMDRAKGGTVCLIVCPTRELASQTATVVDILTRPTWLVGGCLSGGEKRKSEKARLRKGISILTATPGRLLDHLSKTESLLLSLKGKLKYLVLDESDRLLDMGLGGQMEQIVQRIRANQPGSGRNGVTWRSLLVSATVSKKEQALAKTLLGVAGKEEWIWARGGSNDKSITNNNVEPTTQDMLDESTPRQLSQLHMTVTAKLRLSSLISFLVQRVHKKERTVVFMSTCDGVDYHHALFTAMDNILVAKNDDDDNDSGIFGNACPVYKLHGSVPHSVRQGILTKFNKDKTALLICTDVAARGLNLARVDWTVQYDPPCEVADYAHRAGRAARAGKAGHSLLFLLPSERQFLDVLELKGVKGMVALSLAHTLNKAAEICSEVTAESKAGHRNKGEAFSSELQRKLEDKIMREDAETKAAYKPPARKKGQPRPPEPSGPLLEGARKAFFAYVRAYPTKEKAVRHIFSSRALHVGHIARSFSLKEPPKSSMVKAAVQSREGADNEEDAEKSARRKRNLTFSSLVEEAQEQVEKNKRQKQQQGHKKKKINLIKSDGTVDSAKARMMLMDRAAKMQQGGMDSF